MSIRKFCHILLLSCALHAAVSGYAQGLVWLDSLEQARASAINQGKLILLMAGSPYCDHCIYMKTVICEDPSVRPIIDEIYVPWFADVATATDYQPYTAELGSWSFPLSCMIDPLTTNMWLFRTAGPFTAGSYEGMLREAARLYPFRPSNLVLQQAVNDSGYQVQGHIWTNCQPVSVYYRVNVGSSNANGFTSASGTTDWTASLAPFVVAGVSNQYTFEVYARFADGSTGNSYSLVFNYQPPQPWICSVGLAADTVHLTLTNLTAGVTNRVERSLDLSQPNGWITITNFLTPASGCSISEPVSPSWERAFYRVSLAP